MENWESLKVVVICLEECVRQGSAELQRQQGFEHVYIYTNSCTCIFTLASVYYICLSYVCYMYELLSSYF